MVLRPRVTDAVERWKYFWRPICGGCRRNGFVDMACGGKSQVNHYIPVLVRYFSHFCCGHLVENLDRGEADESKQGARWVLLAGNYTHDQLGGLRSGWDQVGLG